MLSAFAKAFGQLSDPRIKKVIGLSVLLVLGVYGLLAGLTWWGLSSFQALPPGWDTAVDVLGVLLVFVVALFLFPAVVSAFIGFFLEDVADAVEARHYPGLPAPRDPPLAEMLLTGLRFAGIAVLLNLLILPLYLIPIAGLVAFYLINGYLLSREYFEMVALRRLDPQQVRMLRETYRGRLWLTGAVTTFLLTVPVLNILAPVLGTAAMVHVAHRLGLRAPA